MDKKRVLKLKNFFDPYPAFEVKVVAGQAEAVRFSASSGRVTAPRRVTAAGGKSAPASTSRKSGLSQSIQSPSAIGRLVQGSLFKGISQSLDRAMMGRSGGRIGTSIPAGRTKSRSGLAAERPPSVGKRIIVSVSGKILNKDAPSWVESTILRYVLGFAYGIHQQEDFVRLEKLLGRFKPPVEGDGLEQIWMRLRRTYFPGRTDLDDYVIQWANRGQRSCLASCNIYRRRVEVAAVMSLPDALPFLEPLVYHEMCHAALGKPRIVNGRRILHGKDFRELERRHPEIPSLDRWIKEGGWHRSVRMFERVSLR